MDKAISKQMRAFIIGIGRAGCKLAYSLIKKNNLNGLLIDSNIADLKAIDYKYRLLIGKGMLNGEGAEYDIELGREALSQDRYFIAEKIVELKQESDDWFFVISSFCGGTGGNADIIIEDLKKNFMERVYHIGFLPSEEDLNEAIANFRRSYEKIANASDAYFPVDVDKIKTSLKLRGNFSRIVDELSNNFSFLLSSEFADLRATLHGLSSISYAEEKFKTKTENLASHILYLSQKSLEKQSIEIEPENAEKAYVLFSSEKRANFAGSIPARLWIEKTFKIKEVRGSDRYVSKNEIKILIVFSGIKKCERVNEIKSLAEAAEKERKIKEEIKELAFKVEKAAEINEELGKSLKEIESFLKHGREN